MRLRKVDCQVPYREFRNPAPAEALAATAVGSCSVPVVVEPMAAVASR
jgi:hypothetical protein